MLGFPIEKSYTFSLPTIAAGKKGFLSCRRKASREEIEQHIRLYKELIEKEKITK
jgi:aerotaxis receptor